MSLEFTTPFSLRKLTKMSFDTKCYSIILSLQPQKVTKIGNAVLRDIEEES